MSAQPHAAPNTGIDLTVDDMRLRVRPDIGCSISNLTKSTQPLLRPATPLDESSGDPLRLACFPMIPYCNRIAGGRFRWRGRDVVLARNMGGEPHSIHGCAWRKPWRVVSRSTSTLVCEYRHDPAARPQDWPWAFLATLEFRLASSRLEVVLSVANLADATMPAGLGIHPFFPRDERTEIDARFQGEWHTDDSLITTHHEAYGNGRNPWSNGKVASRHVDQVFTGREGEVVVRWPDEPHSLHLNATTNLPHTVIYVPEGEDFFCVEPVSHIPNSHNQAGHPNHEDIRALGAQEQMQASVTFEVGGSAENAS